MLISNPNQKQLMEQYPKDVIEEILEILPQTSTYGPCLFPGKLNKMSRILLCRLLPTTIVIKMLSAVTGKQIPRTAL